MHLGPLGIILGVLGAAYFVPTFLAIFKKSDKVQTITLVNLLLGWTIIGWIVALVMSVSVAVLERDTRSETVCAAIVTLR